MVDQAKKNKKYPYTDANQDLQVMSNEQVIVEDNESTFLHINEDETSLKKTGQQSNYNNNSPDVGRIF